jgi:hypothetical protein
VFSGKTPKGIEADDAPKPLKTINVKKWKIHIGKIEVVFIILMVLTKVIHCQIFY